VAREEYRFGMAVPVIASGGGGYQDQGDPRLGGLSTHLPADQFGATVGHDADPGQRAKPWKPSAIRWR